MLLGGSLYFLPDFWEQVLKAAQRELEKQQQTAKLQLSFFDEFNSMSDDDRDAIRLIMEEREQNTDTSQLVEDDPLPDNVILFRKQ